MLFTSIRRCEYSFIKYVLENECVSEKTYEVGRGPKLSKMAVAKPKVSKSRVGGSKPKKNNHGVKKTGKGAKAKGNLKRPANK